MSKYPVRLKWENSGDTRCGRRGKITLYWINPHQHLHGRFQLLTNMPGSAQTYIFDSVAEAKNFAEIDFDEWLQKTGLQERPFAKRAAESKHTKAK